MPTVFRKQAKANFLQLRSIDTLKLPIATLKSKVENGPTTNGVAIRDLLKGLSSPYTEIQLTFEKVEKIVDRLLKRNYGGNEAEVDERKHIIQKGRVKVVPIGGKPMHDNFAFWVWVPTPSYIKDATVSDTSISIHVNALLDGTYVCKIS